MASVTVIVFVIHQPLKPGISLCSVIVLLGQLNNKSCSKSEEIHMCCQVSRSLYNFNSSILYSSYFLHTYNHIDSSSNDNSSVWGSQAWLLFWSFSDMATSLWIHTNTQMINDTKRSFKSHSILTQKLRNVESTIDRTNLIISWKITTESNDKR